MEKTKFEFVMREHGKKIYNYLLKVLRNPEDAEDVMQESFLAFYKRMAFIDEEKCLSYLYQTAYHKALNLIKKNKHKNKVVTLNFEPPAKEVEVVDDEPKKQAIKQALLKLPARYATLLDLQFYQKKSYKEISEILELSVSAIDSRLVRAKKKLKKILEQDFKGNKV